MTDPMQTACIQRARSALDFAAQNASRNGRAKAFGELAFSLLRARRADDIGDLLRRH